MSVTGSIMAGVGLAGSIGGAAISSNAASNAASEQSQAADQAAQLQYQASQNALNFQEQQWNTEQQNLQPWLQSGTGALSNLDYLMGISPQSPQSFGNTTASNVPAQGTYGMPSLSPTNPTAGQQSPNTGATPVSSNPGFSNGVRNGGAYGTAQATSGAIPASSAGLTLAGSNPNSTTSSGAIPAGSVRTPSSSTGSATTTGGYGSLLQPYSQQFSAPTAAQMEQNDPGYQARLQLGTDALQRSAAAAGGVVTGGTAQALNQYAQDYASNEYNNYYNQAYNTYATNYNQYEQQQNNEYNRLASLAGVGQTAANQLATSGQAASNNVSSNLLNTANSMGQSYQNAAAANASGIVGGANAWSGALSGTANSISQLALLQQLYGGSSSGGSIYDDLTMGY